MQRYRCHKIVEAQDLKDKKVQLTWGTSGNLTVFVPGEFNETIPANRITSRSSEEVEDGYLVRYKDGYISWSPRAAFEEGYAAIPPDAV